MAVKLRAGVANTGPDGQASWFDMGANIAVAGATATTTTVSTIGQIVTTPSKTLAGAGYLDSLASGAPIARLEAPQIALLTALTAQTALAVVVGVYRAGALVGGGYAFGWQYTGGSGALSGGAGTPAFAALVAQAMPALTANTALVSAAGTSYLPLQPGDVIVVAVATQTGTVAVPNAIVTPTII